MQVDNHARVMSRLAGGELLVLLVLLLRMMMVGVLQMAVVMVPRGH